VTDIPAARAPYPSRSERTSTVLFVEDEAPIRVLLVDWLEECGFAVLEAGHAGAAIQLAAYGELPIDAVVTDICMPGEIDGVGLAHWFQRNCPAVPIIITSGICSEAAKGTTGDGVFFFLKPYDCAAIAAKLGGMIESVRGQAFQ
jgi:DNA-binding NtrC family response regulator